MTAGRLAAVAPSATTNTVLYSSDINDTTSGVVHICNRGGSAGTYRLAHKDYTQELTLDANTYKFQKGNVVTKYKLALTPGLTVGDATPGLEISGAQSNFTAKLADVVKTTTTTTYSVKVATTSNIGVDSAQNAGTFQGGETITGSVSGLTATFRGTSTTGLNIEMANMGTGVTSVPVTSATNINANDYLFLSDGTASAEVVTVTNAAFNSGTTGPGVLTITRGTFGTTPAAHTPGQYVTAYTPSGTTTTINEGGTFASGDTTLTVTNGAAILSGSYIVIGNEILQATNVSGNDVTVVRGQMGTTAANHNDGVTVTPLTAAGSAGFYIFVTGETLTGGTSNATTVVQDTITVDKTFTAGFIWSVTSGQEVVPETTFSLNIDQTYRFDISDSTNTGLPFRFSDVNEGTNATPTPGTEFTTGVTKVGTAGSGGTAYIEIAISATTPDPIFYYADGQAGYSGSIDVNADPTFSEVFIYDVVGTPITGNTFTVGTASQTVGVVTAGAFGYVTSWDTTTSKLKVFVDNDSPAAFASSDTFPDTPPGQGPTRAVATVSSVTAATDVETGDYLYYDTAIGANATAEHKGLIIGPGSHLIVYASSADMSAQVNGFVNTVSDYSIVDYVPPAGGIGGGGGGGAAP